MNIRGKLVLGFMAKKKKSRLVNFLLIRSLRCLWKKSKTNGQDGVATADQIAAAEIQMQKESEVQQNGEIDSSIGDRTRRLQTRTRLSGIISSM